MCNISGGTIHPIMNRINHMTTMQIRKRDTNKDHVLSVEELGVCEEKFAEIDRNEDDQVERRELKAAYMFNHMTTMQINKRDTNKDHVLSVEELGVCEKKFAEIDCDEDGQIDREEFNDLKLKIVSTYEPPREEASQYINESV